MNTSLTALLLSSGMKSLVLFSLSFLMYRKWRRQSKRYFTDFPFLMALTFGFYGLGKLLDTFLYYYFRNEVSLGSLATVEVPNAFLLTKVRFVLSPILVVIPFTILMLEIWFVDRKRLQVAIGSIWTVLSFTSVIIFQEYNQLLVSNALISLGPILLSIVTFIIIHKNRRLPEINSLILAIGWFGFVITQLIRPIWREMPSDSIWGMTWIGELLEMAAMVIVGIGFLIPAFYASKKSQTNRKLRENQQQPQVSSYT